MLQGVCYIRKGWKLLIVLRVLVGFERHCLAIPVQHYSRKNEKKEQAKNEGSGAGVGGVFSH